MSTIVKPNNFSPNTSISSSAVNDNFDVIYNEFNGNISAANLATDAVTTTKIANSNVTTAKIADGNVTTAKLADASVGNAKLSTGTDEPGGAWNSWTPTFTNVSGGTLNYAKYKVVGKTVHLRLGYTLAGANVSGIITFTPPVTRHADTTPTLPVMAGNAQFFDTSAGSRIYGFGLLAGSTIQLYVTGASTTYANLVSTSSTVPFTWATGDTIDASLTYEAA